MVGLGWLFVVVGFFMCGVLMYVTVGVFVRWCVLGGTKCARGKMKVTVRRVIVKIEVTLLCKLKIIYVITSYYLSRDSNLPYQVEHSTL